MTWLLAWILAPTALWIGAVELWTWWHGCEERLETITDTEERRG